jgi:hypothetical protein
MEILKEQIDGLYATAIADLTNIRTGKSDVKSTDYIWAIFPTIKATSSTLKAPPKLIYELIQNQTAGDSLRTLLLTFVDTINRRRLDDTGKDPTTWLIKTDDRGRIGHFIVEQMNQQKIQKKRSPPWFEYVMAYLKHYFWKEWQHAFYEAQPANRDDTRPPPFIAPAVADTPWSNEDEDKTKSAKSAVAAVAAPATAAAAAAAAAAAPAAGTRRAAVGGEHQESSPTSMLFELCSNRGEYDNQRRCLELLDSAIRKAGGVDVKDPSGWTPLICAASRNLNLIVEYLIKKGANVNAQGHRRGTSALMTAVYFKNAEVVRTLLRSGANIALTDNAGKTALDIPDSSPEYAEVRAVLETASAAATAASRSRRRATAAAPEQDYSEDEDESKAQPAAAASTVAAAAVVAAAKRAKATSAAAAAVAEREAAAAAVAAAASVADAERAAGAAAAAPTAAAVAATTPAPAAVSWPPTPPLPPPRVPMVPPSNASVNRLRHVHASLCVMHDLMQNARHPTAQCEVNCQLHGNPVRYEADMAAMLLLRDLRRTNHRQPTSAYEVIH